MSYRFNVLELTDGIENLGGIRWQLFVCFVVAWLIIFLSLCKGVKSLGKVIYVTATLFYLNPDFSRLLEFKVCRRVSGSFFNFFNYNSCVPLLGVG